MKIKFFCFRYIHKHYVLGMIIYSTQKKKLKFISDTITSVNKSFSLTFQSFKTFFLWFITKKKGKTLYKFSFNLILQMDLNFIDLWLYFPSSYQTNNIFSIQFRYIFKKLNLWLYTIFINQSSIIIKFKDLQKNI